MSLKLIRGNLIRLSQPEVIVAAQKYIPSAQVVYGVRVPHLNALAKQYRDGGFPLVRELWRAGAFEERLLATKLLGIIAKKDPNETLRLLRTFSHDLSDWATCDTLATQAIRPLVKDHRRELFDIAKEFLVSEGFWVRRCGIVILTNYAKDKTLKPSILGLVRHLRSNKEHYIKKALEWLDRDLR